MKILFVSPHFHSFKHSCGGAEQRTYLLLKALTGFAEVDFVAFHEAAGFDQLPINVVYQQKTSNGSIISKWEKWLPVLRFWNRKTIFPVNKNKAKIVAKFAQNADYDLIVTRYIPKAMECDLLRFADKLWLDVDDLPSDYYHIMASNAKSRSGKIRYALLSKIAKFHQRKIIKKVKKTTFPNPDAARYFTGAYLPNIPFYEQTCPPVDFLRTEKRIFFIGNLYHEPNFLGVEYFLKKIYLPLKQRVADVEFYIGGGYRDNLRDVWGKYADVHLLGFVPDLRAEYEKSRVVVVPVYHGAGTNIKVVEALQMNRCCVLSEFATRGFSDIFIDGTDYFVAKNDAQFVSLLETLLADENLNRQTAENGTQKVQEHFSFAAFSETAGKILNQ
ncbi:hypothetical protein FACS189429_8390 [Bacteroidia bacterium]|nr:hypothetical protein FACS189429_8390 [Bacteroidia bacterium]